MDRPRPAPHCIMIHRRSQSPVPPTTSNHSTRNSHEKKNPPPPIGYRSPPISQLSRRLRAKKGERATTLQTLGPQHRPKTRSPGNPHQQNHPPLPHQTRGTHTIPQRAHRTRNDPGVKKPLRSILLFHQEEKWETQTRSRLPTGKRLDDKKPVPAPPHPLSNQPTTRLHQVHRGRHQVGVQRGAHQTEGPVKGSLYHQRRALQANSHVLRSHQLTRHLPNHDEHDLLGPHRRRKCDYLHGQHSHPHRTQTRRK